MPRPCGPAAYNSPVIAHSDGLAEVRGTMDYLIAAVLFAAIVSTLVYLWKREHPK